MDLFDIYLLFWTKRQPQVQTDDCCAPKDPLCGDRAIVDESSRAVVGIGTLRQAVRTITGPKSNTLTPYEAGFSLYSGWEAARRRASAKTKAPDKSRHPSPLKQLISCLSGASIPFAVCQVTKKNYLILGIFLDSSMVS